VGLYLPSAICPHAVVFSCAQEQPLTDIKHESGDTSTRTGICSSLIVFQTKSVASTTSEAIKMINVNLYRNAFGLVVTHVLQSYSYLHGFNESEKKNSKSVINIFANGFLRFFIFD
jgi:glutamine amidotransferase PdxT